MKSSVLWYQSAILNSDDVVVVDGVILPKGTVRKERFHELYEISDKVSDKSVQWHGKIRNCYFVKGSLNAKDEYGRPLAFMFAAPIEKWEESFKQSIAATGYELSDETIECLKKKQVHYNNKVLIIAACVLLIAILTIIIYGYGKYAEGSAIVVCGR